MTSRASKKADRIFVQNGRRLYRRRFSLRESRIGFGILVALAAVLSWIAWKGAHPDPNLFMLETDLAQAGTAPAVDRGPVPPELAADGWSEGAISTFGYDNLYEKINGREGYYKSFGFEQLYSVTLSSDDDLQTVVDIELYDLGKAANAIGAYSGERSEDATPIADKAGMRHVDRNALYLTRGRYYLRAIGSAESPAVRAQLEHLQSRFAQGLPGEPLPWGFALFVGQMGMPPGSVSFTPENAFSFGFARNVYTATLEGETELFVTPAPADAPALAKRFLDGFRQYGQDEGDFVRDRYLGTFATARAAGPWVVGIRSATDTNMARTAVDELAAVVRQLPLPEQDSEPTAPQSVEEEYDTDAY